MTTLPVTFRGAPLPVDFSGTPQAFFDAMVARLSIQTDTNFSIFTIGSSAPTSNSGPWLKNGVTWYVWDAGTGAYIPEILESRSLRYVASASAPSQALYTFWIELDGSGKAIALKYYSGGAWKDVYEDKFATYSTTAQMNSAIAAAVAGINLAMIKSPASAKLTGNQTIAIDGTLYKVLFNSAVVNPNSAYDAANSKYVCPKNGIYRVTTNIQVDNSGGDATAMEIAVRISVNGAAGPNDPVSGTAVASPPGGRWYPQVDGLIAATAGDAIEVYFSAEDGVDAASVIIAAQSQFFVEMVQAT